MTHFPPSIAQEKRKRALRIVGILLSGLMVVMVVAIFVLIVRSESAHDEAKCKFTTSSVRIFGDVTVFEESRNCVPEAEEHRWLLQHDGKEKREFARKRLPKYMFAPDSATWTIERDKAGLVVMKLHVQGQPDTEFREADAPK